MDRTHCSPHPTSPHRLQEPHRPCPVAQLGNALRERERHCHLLPGPGFPGSAPGEGHHHPQQERGGGDAVPIPLHKATCSSWAGEPHLYTSDFTVRLMALRPPSPPAITTSVLISLRVRCQLTVPLQRGCPEQIPPSPCLPPRAACVNNTTNRPSGLPLPSPNC